MSGSVRWQQLVEELDAWTAASAEAPGRIEVSVPHGAAIVVMTAEEWDEMVGVMWGNVPDAVEDVKRTLLSLQPHQGFAVYNRYRLYPSAEPSLSDSAEPEGTAGGKWVALDRDGRVSGSFTGVGEPPDAE